MAGTTFEVRGHTLFYLTGYAQYSFIFSAVLEGRIQYYQFKEQKTEQEINEADEAHLQPGAPPSPIVIIARGAGGPKFMTFEGQSNKVFVKVELWDEWGVFWFMPMRKGSGGKIEDVRGHVERLGNPQILNGDPWKNPPGP